MVNMLVSRVIDRGFVHDCSDKFFKITGFDEFFCCLIKIFVPSNTFKVSFYFINVLLKVHQIGYYVFYGSGIGSLLLLEEGHLQTHYSVFSCLTRIVMRAFAIIWRPSSVYLHISILSFVLLMWRLEPNFTGKIFRRSASKIPLFLYDSYIILMNQTQQIILKVVFP